MHKKRFQICIYTVSRVSFDTEMGEKPRCIISISNLRLFRSHVWYICADVSIFFKINP